MKTTQLSPLTQWLAAACVGLLVMQTILLVLRRRHRQRTFQRMRVPGPKPHLISGQLYETRRQPYVLFAQKMHERFGDNVGVYLGGDPYLLTKDLELIQQVFVAKSRLFYDRMDFYLNVDPVPDNLICQRGDRWRYMRKLLTPAFTTSRIRSTHFYRDTQQTVEKIFRQLEAHSGANEAGLRETIVEDAYDRMAAIALDVIVKTAFHMDNMISFEGPLRSAPKGKRGQQSTTITFDAFLETVKRACRLGFNPIVELIFCFPFLDRPLTSLCNRLYFGSIIKLLFDRLDYLVRRSERRPRASGKPADQGARVGGEAKNDTARSASVTSEPQRRRIVDSLIEVLREGKITRSEFTGNAFVIVFAGFETTANALTFTLWLLAKHERVQTKLRQELVQRIGPTRPTTQQKDEREQDEHLAELATGCEYLEMVINESLRLFPPVPGLSCRQASTECRLSSGLVVEKGVNVVPSVFTIHRDKSIWGQDANEFRPERFEALDVGKLNSAMFMPFGLGPRNCIGKALAMHEMKIVIGRLIQAYSIESCKHMTPEKLRLCSPINITLTNSEKIGLKFVKLAC